VPTQPAKELFEVRERQLLPLTDPGKRNGPALLTQRQVDHGGHSEPTFGRQTHRFASLVRMLG
jgi:hypothetical protein